MLGLSTGKAQDPQAFRRLANSAPHASLVVAHSGLWEYPEVLAAVRNCPNVWLDISFQHPIVLRELHDAVGAERMILGSDFPVGRVDLVLKNLAVAGFSEKNIARIVWENAGKLLRSSR